MSEVDEVIKRILALKPQLNREAVAKLIDEERAKASGLLTEEAAAHLVAANLGLDGAGEQIEAKLRIGDLTSGLGDVSLTGRVIHVFPSRSFARRDGREGKVLRMLIGDRTGTVAVVFWDEKADRVSASKVKPGKIVRVLHGYTRKRQGEVEVNVGGRGEIYQEPLDAVDDNYPSLESFFVTPREVRSAGSVNLVGVVVDKYPASTFTRRDGSAGKVARLVLEEGGGRVNVVLWDAEVDRLGNVDVGTRIRLINGSVRARGDGRPEVHVTSTTAAEVLEVGVAPSEPVSIWTKIAELADGMQAVNVVARVAQIGEAREFVRRDGTAGRVASVLLRDDSGSVNLNLWGEDVERLKDLSVGSTVAVENGYTRLGLGAVSLNVGQSGRLVVNPENVEVSARGVEQEITEIRDLREGQTNVIVRGRLVEAPQVREVETARGPAKVASFRVSDGTGEARVSLWRDLVKEAEGLSLGTELRIENCLVKPPFDGAIQLSSGIFTRIVIEKK